MLASLFVALLADAAAHASPPQPASERTAATEAGREAPDAQPRSTWAVDFELRKAALARVNGRDHAAIVPLLGVDSELFGEVDHAALSAWLDETARDPKRHALVRTYAATLRLWLQETTLDPVAREQARQGLAALGVVTTASFIGPFENSGDNGHDREYGPERDPWAPEQSFGEGIDGASVAWRVLPPDVSVHSRIDTDGLVRPHKEHTTYLRVWFFVPRGQDVAIQLGTPGRYKLWVDRVAAGSGGGERTAHSLQDSHGVRVGNGWHSLLLKISSASTEAGAYIRVSARDGSAVSGLRIAATPPAGAPADGASGTKANVSIESLRTKLEAAADKQTASTAELEAWVAFFEAVRPYSSEDRRGVAAARRLDQRDKTVESAWLLARVEADANGRRAALESGLSRARAQQAVARSLGRPLSQRTRRAYTRMLFDTAVRDGELGLRRRMEDLFAEAQAVSPGDSMLDWIDLEVMAADGFTLSSLDKFESLAARHPASAKIWGGYADRLAAAGFIERSIAAAEHVLTLHPHTPQLAVDLVQRNLELGRTDRARAIVDAYLAISPHDADAHLLAARVAQAHGDLERQRRHVASAIEWAPTEPALHELLGDVEARQGHDAEAVAAWQRSLAIRPQQPALRDRIAAFAGTVVADLYDARGADLVEVAKKATPKSWAGLSSGILHRRIAVRVLPNGLSERLHQEFVRIVDERGAQNERVQAFGFDPSQSTIDVRRARVHRADGRIEDIGKTEIVPVSEAGYRMYYDQRQVRVTFPTLAPGDTLEVAFVRRDTAESNMFGAYFGDMVALAGLQPVERFEYVLEAPATLGLFFNQRVDRTPSEDGTAVAYALTRDAVAAIKPEPRMTGYTDVSEYFHVSTYETWDAVGRWYWDLVRGQLVVDDAIRNAVRDVIANLPAKATERDKIDAIYRHVIRSTRYIGLEFGIHGYKPYRTTEVYDRKFGDCKDKASLLKVMLAEIGIPSHLVLVRTRELGRISDLPASLAAFNHAIVYVPGHDLFLDGTAEWSGPDELPSGDQGATVLVVYDGKGAGLRTIPYGAPEKEVFERKLDVFVSKDGSADATQTITIRGSNAAGWRTRLQSETERKTAISNYVVATYAGANVRSTTVSDVTDVLQPVKIEIVTSIPSWGQPSGQGLRFLVEGRASDLLRSVAGPLQRTHAIAMGVPSTEAQITRISLPPGWSFTAVPKPVRIDTAFGRFSLDVKIEGNVAIVERTLVVTMAELPAASYGDLRSGLRAIDEALAQVFEVRPGTGGDR